MSDDVLKLIPHDSAFVPDVVTHARAVELLENMFPDGEMCEAKVYDRIEFIDCGQNLEAVICPSCRGRTPLDPFTENDPGMNWWYGVQDQTLESAMHELETTMPCCRSVVAFASLQFDWPVGFARFELSIWNPNVSDAMSDGALAPFEALLGCRLKQVRAHY